MAYLIHLVGDRIWSANPFYHPDISGPTGFLIILVTDWGYTAISELAYAILAKNVNGDWIIVNDYQAAEWFAKIPEWS
ncbi:hypothetical protein [Syntrophorhabdus aromaticivorans]|uniref:hypothetical protein n=1 Tax=Syntrophorhabdus aromaticivorans TaxID=328301 RepID=UPI0012ECAE89|nr:hypothetical protein [Syntrophorhabdus aromaticivorans]